MKIAWQQIGGGVIAAGVGALAAVAAMGGFSAHPPAGDGSEVRRYLLAHPEVIPEALGELQDRQTAQAIAANRAAITTPFPGAIAGDPHGDVTLAEYYDYACGYCRASVADVDRLVASDPHVRVVFKELPILSPESDGAARMSLAAASAGKFAAFHHALYAGGPLSAAKVRAVAERLGLDPAAADAPAVTGEVASNLDTARSLRMTGTPTFVVGDQILAGAVGYQALKDAVDKARAGGADHA